MFQTTNQSSIPPIHSGFFSDFFQWKPFSSMVHLLFHLLMMIFHGYVKGNQQNSWYNHQKVGSIYTGGGQQEELGF